MQKLRVSESVRPVRAGLRPVFTGEPPTLGGGKPAHTGFSSKCDGDQNNVPRLKMAWRVRSRSIFGHSRKGLRHGLATQRSKLFERSSKTSKPISQFETR